MMRWLLMSLAGALALGWALMVSLPGIPQSGTPVRVTVSVDGQPADALIRVFQNEQLFQVEYTDVHTPGVAAFALPPGGYVLQVEHGAGFTSLPVRRELVVEGTTPQRVDVEISRLLDPHEDGYYSADLHTHTIASAESTLRIFGIPNHGSTPVDQAVGVQLAADLDVPFISDHNTVAGHETFAQTADERGVPYLLSEEITTVLWGHYNAYALRPGQLVEFAFAKLPGQFFDEARQAGAAMIQINHPYSVGFGYFFTEKQPQFDDRFDAVEVFNGEFGDDDFQTILRLFEFWNQGRRLVATAVSDDHFWKKMDNEYGTPRTYVAVQGALSAEAFLQALTGGHAFATYGPLIVFSAEGGTGPGDVLQRPAGSTLTLSAQVQSVRPLDGLQAELVHNGKVVQTAALSGLEQQLAFEEVVNESGWYALRIMSSPRRYRALTNPLWIEVLSGS